MIREALSPGGFFVQERIENLRGDRVLLIPRKGFELFERRFQENGHVSTLTDLYGILCRVEYAVGS